MDSSVTLGVYVGPETVDAVLVRPVGDRIEPLQRFTRSRARSGELTTASEMASALPGLNKGDQDDYTLQVGGDWSSGGGASSSGDGAPSAGAVSGGPFARELKEILTECAAAGYEEVRLAFALTAPEVHYLDLPDAPAEASDADGAKDRKPKKGKGTSDPKKRLQEKVLKQVPSADVRRTAYVPLATPAGPHTLAVAVEADDSVSGTLALLGESDAAHIAAARLDAEATLLASVVGRTRSADEEQTVVVRVGPQDTLVLFLTGSTLAGVERLRSLTAYDRPETIVSRVLLQQDERKSGDPDSVFVASSGRDELLMDAFADSFPASAVEPLAAVLTGLGVDVPTNEDAYRAGTLVAAAAAAREAAGWTDAPDVHLLSPKLRKRRRTSSFAWPTALAALLLVATVAFAGYRYVDKEQEIETIREDLRLNPPILPDEDPEQLQARVDSLNRTFATYTRALDVLDSLLIGSDRWTQSLRLVTRTTAATGGSWLQSWTPEAAGIRIVGQTLARDRIVELSRRLNGAVGSVEYAEVGPNRVYTFEMGIPVQDGMPEAAAFLRTIAADGASVRDSMAALSTANPGAFVMAPAGHDH